MKKLILLAAATFVSVMTSQAYTMIWHFTGTIPSDKRSAITSAMNTSCANYNLYSHNWYQGDITVAYNSGVPTAQCAGWKGVITFGGLYSQRVAQHEMGHWFVVGTHWNWNANRTGNTWKGVNAKAKLKTFDGSSAILYADAVHFWPYGWNYDNEGPARRNCDMVSGLRWDCGLSHNYY
jgi:hypothetical protein